MTISPRVLAETISIHAASYPIKAVFHMSLGNQSCFVKTDNLDRLPAFEAEMAAMEQIAQTDTLHVPRPIGAGVTSERSFLVSEWWNLHSLDEGAAARLGRRLAALHRHTAPQFGWNRNNAIGSTLQINDWTADWLTFWKEYRLGFQLRLAADNGYTGQLQTLGQELLERCPALFINYFPQPSLLHGDLWRGNAARTESGEPIVFDPASYYGDRETDLAMAYLFHGFPDAFFAAYQAAWPVDHSYKMRRDFYNIYHLLNHLNLFGQSYLARTEEMMQSVLAHMPGQ